MIESLAGLPGKIKTLLGRVPSDNTTKMARLDDDITSRAPASTAVSTANLSVARIQKLDNLDAPVTEAGFKNCDMYTSNATWNVPTGVSVIYVTMVGAGGGGGGGGSANSSKGGSAGSGGSSGEIAFRIPMKVTPQVSVSISIPSVPQGGSGASNGTDDATNGGAGGTTRVEQPSGSGILLKVRGGRNGKRGRWGGLSQPITGGALVGGATLAGPYMQGNTGGTGAAYYGDSTKGGDSGGYTGGAAGSTTNKDFGYGGGGGSASPFGDGGAGGNGPTVATGQPAAGGNGAAYGAGGGGGGAGSAWTGSGTISTPGKNGGNGGGGLVLIEY